MTPFDFHTFRDWNTRLGRFVWFALVAGDALGDANGDPTPGEAPERATEASGDSDDSDDRALDHRLGEMARLLDEWNAELSSGGDLSVDNPFKGVDADLLPTAQRFLDEAYRELSTQHEQDLATALAGFCEIQGPIQQELSGVLLAASDSWGLSEETPDIESVAETGAGGNYTVKSGDTMYDILTTQLADSTLRSKVAGHYGLSTDLAPKDLVLKLFAKTNAEALPNNRLKQDLIYPGDHIFFNSSGLIQYMPRTPESSTPVVPGQPAGDAVAAVGTESGGDGLAQVDDEAPATGEEAGEADADKDRDDSPRASPLEDGVPSAAVDAAPPPAAEAEPAAPAVEAAPADETAPADAPGEPEPTITESEKLGDLTVNYGEGVHDLLYRYGIAEGKLQFNEISSNTYALDPNTFPKGTVILNPSDATNRFPLAADYLKNNLSLDSANYTEITIQKVNDTVLHISYQPKNGTHPLYTTIHLPKLTENRREKAVEAALGEFVEAEIKLEDIQVKHEYDPEDPNLNRVSITLNKVVIRGRIYGGFKAKASAPDAEQAQKQAIMNLHDQVKTLYEKTIKDQHEATLAILPADFPALTKYIQQHPEIYDLSFEQNPLPGDASGTVGVEMKLSFKIHGIPTNFSISKERGPNLAEAIRRSQKTLMEILTKHDTGPLEAEAIHPRTVAPSTAAEAVDTRKTERFPVTPSEQYAYFRDSITERSDGIYFQFFHPVASLNTGEPCEGLLKPDGTLRLKGPTGLDVSFQVSYTARQNGVDVAQQFGKVRLIKTRSGSYGGGAEPRSYKEFMEEPLKPWVDKVSDSRGNFVRTDLVIGDGFLYDVVRDALAKPARQPDGTERPDPETFLGQYRVSNDSPSASRSAALPSGTNYLWIKPIEKKL